MNRHNLMSAPGQVKRSDRRSGRNVITSLNRRRGLNDLNYIQNYYELNPLPVRIFVPITLTVTPAASIATITTDLFTTSTTLTATAISTETLTLTESVTATSVSQTSTTSIESTITTETFATTTTTNTTSLTTTTFITTTTIAA